MKGKDNHDEDYLSSIEHVAQLDGIYFAIGNEAEKNSSSIRLNLDSIQEHQKMDNHFKDPIDQIQRTGEIKKGIYRANRDITLKAGLHIKAKDS